MFIITSVITLPLAFVGLLLWPGTPDKPNKIFLSDHEIAIARSRLERHGAQLKALPFSWDRLRRIFTGWKFYVLVIFDILFFNTSANSAAFLLWIKSLHRYDIPTINNLGTIAPALGIFYVLFINFGADLFLGRPGAITLASVWSKSDVLGVKFPIPACLMNSLLCLKLRETVNSRILPNKY